MTILDNEGVPHPTRSESATGTVRLKELRSAVPEAATQASRGVGRSPARRDAGVLSGLLAVDALAALAAVTVLDGSRTDVLWTFSGLFSLLWPLNAAGGHYRLRLALSVLDELPSLAARAAVAIAFTLALQHCLSGWWPTAVPPDGRLVCALLLCHLTLDFLGRGAVNVLARRARRRNPRPTLIAGAGQVGQRIAAALLQHPEYGLSPVGYVDPDPIILPGESTVPVLGGPSVLDRVILELGVGDVILVPSSGEAAQTAATLRAGARHGCAVWFVPVLPACALVSYGDRRTSMADHLWGFPCFRLSLGSGRRAPRAFKRAFDIALAVVGLLLTSPVLAACALAVRIEGGPGVVFRQERVGLDEEPFTVLKFRTLRPVDEHESATHWNISHDDRLGRVGRFLRRSSLDELPQLWNVLRGEMSMVGPRPERPYFVSRFAQAYPQYRDRHRVRVGITGLAQVNGLRGDTSIEDRTRFDNYYIDNWSLWQDVKIVLRTVSSLLRPDGA